MNKRLTEMLDRISAAGHVSGTTMRKIGSVVIMCIIGFFVLVIFGTATFFYGMATGLKKNDA